MRHAPMGSRVDPWMARGCLMTQVEEFAASGRQRVRSIWISDVHLGTRDCQAEKLDGFLGEFDCDHLYLVGDIIAGCRLRKSMYWPQPHPTVVRRILSMARHAPRVVYVPGNHDELPRRYRALN